MIEYLENINQKHTATILKMQDKSFVSSDNSVQISHLLHQDFINVMQSKNKLQEGLISSKDSIEDLESIVEEIVSFRLKYKINILTNLNIFCRKILLHRYVTNILSDYTNLNQQKDYLTMLWN